MRKGTMANPHNRVDYLSHIFGTFSGVGAAVYINKGLHLTKGKPAQERGYSASPLNGSRELTTAK